MKVFEGKVKGSGRRIVIVASKFNDFITKRLVEACVDELKKNGVADKNITLAWVPGAYEIPMAALKLGKKKTVDAVICLGAVIRGETLHYELVAQGAAEGISRVSLMIQKPVVFEVLAADTIELVNQRSKKRGSNKGRDAALVALEMCDLISQL